MENPPVERIIQFLADHPVTPVFQTPQDDLVNKCGVLPYFVAAGALEFFVMRPRARKEMLGQPEFQICKGTRKRWDAQKAKWRDVKRSELVLGNLEPLAATSLREGMEEIGLRLENIESMLDAGTVGFRSATSGDEKPMRLLLARMKEQGGFHPITSDHPDTDAARWCSLAEFRIIGRADHVVIIERVALMLKEMPA